MTEDEARDWIRTSVGVSRETTLARYVDMLIDESSRQNLIAPSTIPSIWSRHIVDSAQLIPLTTRDGRWLDIGSGAGLPGIVVSILRDAPITLVEPRQRRCDFLNHCVAELELKNVDVRKCRIDALIVPAAVISARAVGSLEQLFRGAIQCSSGQTTWLLPRGKSGRDELVQARKSWQGSFHVEQSLTHPDSNIVVARGVRRR